MARRYVHTVRALVTDGRARMWCGAEKDPSLPGDGQGVTGAGGVSLWFDADARPGAACPGCAAALVFASDLRASL